MQTGIHLAPSARMLLLSNSRDTSGNYLVHARDAWADIADGRKKALFFPFAGTTMDWDDYLGLVQKALAWLEMTIVGAHRCADLNAATAHADILLVGGGNTFRLLLELRERGCLQSIGQAVQAGTPYVGWSAGSVVATPSIATTNDMPIVDPGGFDALGLVPFQINAHYTNALPAGHQGETRNQRIAEYLVLHPAQSVLALPEGNWMEWRQGQATVHGPQPSWWFRAGQAPTALQGGGIITI